METKINVAEILKDKPKCTRLYSDICCGECVLNDVSENAIYVDMYNEERFWYFSVYGTIYAFPNGGVMLYPSYEMRDWRKFAWKKGDVLVSNDGKREVLFKTWANDSYTKFVGLHCLIINDNEEVEYDNGTTVFNTNDFKGIEAEDDVQTYIKTIEEKLGGKLNRETLEVEKAQPEFKDGDILLYKSAKFTFFSSIFILNTKRNEMSSYVRFSIGKGSIDYDVPVCNLYTDRFRYATEEEKQQLFDALAKEGKAWNAEKKEIVDLKPKIKFKPFDKVVARDGEDLVWFADLFSHIDKENNRFACVGNLWNVCLPYNEETAKLIGTTNNVEG